MSTALCAAFASTFHRRGPTCARGQSSFTPRTHEKLTSAILPMTRSPTSGRYLLAAPQSALARLPARTSHALCPQRPDRNEFVDALQCPRNRGEHHLVLDVRAVAPARRKTSISASAQCSGGGRGAHLIHLPESAITSPGPATRPLPTRVDGPASAEPSMSSIRMSSVGSGRAAGGGCRLEVVGVMIWNMVKSQRRRGWRGARGRGVDESELPATNLAKSSLAG